MKESPVVQGTHMAGIDVYHGALNAAKKAGLIGMPGRNDILDRMRHLHRRP